MQVQVETSVIVMGATGAMQRGLKVIKKLKN